MQCKLQYYGLKHIQPNTFVNYLIVLYIIRKMNMIRVFMCIKTGKNKMSQIERLLHIMNRLRDSKNGCPWDLKQSHESLKQYLLEEAHEVIEAIDANDKDELKKELGDLLLQIVFHSQIASETKAFNFEDVAASICEKMETRHPHIFSTPDKDITPEEVERNWELIKKEKEGKKRVLDGVPKSYNALLRSLRIQQKAASVGFEWPDTKGVMDKVNEEINELKEAIENKDQLHMEEEFGDMLFTLVNCAKRLGVNPENALQKSNNKFINRFNYIEEKVEAEGEKIADKTLEELDSIWDEAKMILENKGNH